MKPRPETRKYDYQKILDLRKQGYSLNQIAEAVGSDKCTIGNICRRHGLGGVLSPNATKSPKDPKKYVESYLPEQFSYVSGYSNSDASVTLKCCVCGGTFEMSTSWIRNVRRKNTHCPLCEGEERNRIAEEKRREREAKEENRIVLSFIRKAQREAERELKEHTVVCEICGKTFVTYYQDRVCCSPECSKKRSNRISSHRKDARISEDKRVDKNITVKGLYKRDKGVCWICGGRCDLKDYTVRDGAIICGNNYPSIDHVVPICEGGEDSWKNVRLAHRICNSKRYFAEKVLDGKRICP